MRPASENLYPSTNPSFHISSGRVRVTVLAETGLEATLPRLTNWQQLTSCVQDVQPAVALVSPFLTSPGLGCPGSGMRSELASAPFAEDLSIVGAETSRHARGMTVSSGSSRQDRLAIRPGPVLDFGSSGSTPHVFRTAVLSRTAPAVSVNSRVPVGHIRRESAAQFSEAQDLICTSRGTFAPPGMSPLPGPACPPGTARSAARKARHAKRNAHECPPAGGKPDRHR